MHALARIAALVAVLGVATSTLARSSSGSQEPGGSIAGRITLSGKGVPGAIVALMPYLPVQNSAPFKATTDEDGRYRLTGVPAGRFTVTPLTPNYVVPGDPRFGQSGKTLTIAEGETVEGIDFALTRGGVITGRVTDAEGRPVIAERVDLTTINEQGQKSQAMFNRISPYMYETDDRGIYRIYGLAAGRYLVSVGVAQNSGVARMGAGRTSFKRTFHPNVTEEAQATILEVTPGSEITDVDIKLGRSVPTFTVAGRIVNTETGQPVPNMMMGYGVMRDDGRSLSSFSTGSRTDLNGEFRLEGVLPGRYSVFATPEGESEFYGDPAPFEVSTEDITGLEIRLRRGATINGVAVVEGTNDPAVLASLSQLQIGSFVQTQGVFAPRMNQAKVAADGTFRVTGLAPGRVDLYLSGPPQKGLTFRRIERDGVTQRQLEIGPNDQVVNIRYILGYGNGTVSGDVKIEGGVLPEGARMQIRARRLGETNTSGSFGGEVDARKHFLIEGLPSGEYELMLMVLPPFTPGAPTRPLRIPPIKQNVTIISGVESPSVTLTLDLSPKERPQ